MHASKLAHMHHSVSFSELTNIDFPLQFYNSGLENVFNMHHSWWIGLLIVAAIAVLAASEGNNFYFINIKLFYFT